MLRPLVALPRTADKRGARAHLAAEGFEDVFGNRTVLRLYDDGRRMWNSLPSVASICGYFCGYRDKVFNKISYRTMNYE